MFYKNNSMKCFISVLSLFMIAIFHLLASIVTWIVMILVSITTIGKLLKYKKVLKKSDYLNCYSIEYNSYI